jgi:hypothetical protein
MCGQTLPRCAGASTRTRCFMEERQSDAHVPAPRHRIEIKVSADQKARIARAADTQGKGLADFVRGAVESAVVAALRDGK